MLICRCTWALGESAWAIEEAAPNPAGAAAETAELRKPAPDARVPPYQERFRALIEAWYPQLLWQQTSGTPTLTVRFIRQGGVLRSDLEVIAQPRGELAVTESNFSRYGRAAQDLQFIGAVTVHLPANNVFIVFAGVGSRDLDYALVQRFFPRVFAAE
jgi:hypothetical protein